MFNVRPGEGRLTIILLVHSFFLGVSLVFFNIAAGALFLEKFDASYLPWVYVGAAAVVTFTGAVYSKLEERLSVSTLLTGNLLFLLLSITTLRLSLASTESTWLLMVVFGWYELMAVLTSLEFWGLAGRLLNVRQGKRLFGLIGSGEVAAGILTGFSTSFIVDRIGVENLLFCSAFGMAGSVLILMYITRAFPERFSPEKTPEREERGESTAPKSLGELARDPYLRLIFVLSGLSVFGYFFVDFAYYERLEDHYSSATEIAEFLGGFAAVEGIVNLLLRAFATGYLLTRFGLGLGLMALPLLLTISALTSVAIGTFATSAAALGVFFWLIVIMKLIDRVCRTAIDEPSVLVLYQPLRRDLRLKVQAVIESIVEPTAGGIAGLLLIFLTSLFVFTAFHAACILLAMLTLWLGVAVLLRREYTVALTKAIAKRAFHGDTLALRDLSSMSVLRKGVESPHPGEVIYAISVMEELGHESLGETLRDLLNHPSPEVRLEALRRIDQRGDVAAVEPILNLLQNEQSARVVGRALQTLCIVWETGALQHVVPFLDDARPEVRCGAIAGLLRSGIEGVLESGEHLNALLKSSNPQERTLGLRVLGEVGIRSFARPVIEMLRDDDRNVRRAALNAAGRLRNPRFWPRVIENLSDHSMRSYAASALVAGGEDALPHLDDAFETPDQVVAVRQRIVRICGRIGGKRAVGLLKRRIDFPHPQVREQILTSLSFCGYRAVGEEEEVVRGLIREEGRTATWVAAVLVDIGKDHAVSLLRQALKHERKKNLDRMFLLLSFIHHAPPILRARESLASESVEKRAYALEILDNLVAQELKTFLVPLVDDIPESQRLERLIGVFPEERLGRSARLDEIIFHRRCWISPWTRAAALYASGQLASRELCQAVTNALSSSSSLVRETAVWALGRLRPPELLEQLEPLTHCSEVNIRELARAIVESAGTIAAGLPQQPRRRVEQSEIDLFASILLDAHESRWRRCHAAHRLGRAHDARAQAPLLAGLGVDDENVRAAVFDALRSSKFHFSDDTSAVFTEQLEAELRGAEQTLAALGALRGQAKCERLTAALEQEIYNGRERVQTLLSLASEDDSYDVLHYWWISNPTQQRPRPAQARLESSLKRIGDGALQERTAALLAHSRPELLAKAWGLQVDDSLEARKSCLQELAFNRSHWSRSWTRACAIEVMEEIRPDGCNALLREASEDSDEMVRETAAWVLAKISADAPPSPIETARVS